jgi:hypothetical protein
MVPSTFPCGTPDSTVASFENSPSRATRILRFVKNVVSHACRGPRWTIHLLVKTSVDCIIYGLYNILLQ